MSVIRKGDMTFDLAALGPWDYVAVLAAGAAHGRTLAARAAAHDADAAGALASRLVVVAATIEHAVVARCDDAVVASLCEGLTPRALEAIEALEGLARG